MLFNDITPIHTNILPPGGPGTGTPGGDDSVEGMDTGEGESNDAFTRAGKERSQSNISLGLSAAAMKDVDIYAPQYRKLDFDLDEAVLLFKQRCQADPTYEQKHAPAEGSTEDLSDEAILARHEVVLERMRSRWDTLKKLKAERREIMGEPDPSTIGNRGAFFSARSPRGQQ